MGSPGPLADAVQPSPSGRKGLSTPRSSSFAELFAVGSAGSKASPARRESTSSALMPQTGALKRADLPAARELSFSGGFPRMTLASPGAEGPRAPPSGAGPDSVFAVSFLGV